MALAKERLGEIAMLAMQFKAEKEGVLLKPSEIKRQVFDSAKKLGIRTKESAELAKIIIAETYKKTVEILDKIIKDDDILIS